ncbi:hypothetical protein [Carnimonas bestiolae]|uniref:hypothetical protein n=1 Tax=Carnimonas bestiolae TaxID=3402172 RepID=UPI003EDB7E03
MKTKLTDNFSYKKFSEELPDFLNNLLSTSVLMAISLVAMMKSFNILAIPVGIFVIIVLLGMYINVKNFISCVIDNPVPKSLRPFYNARGPKPLGWFVEFFKILFKEKKYIRTGAIIFTIVETMVIVNFCSVLVNIKSFM